jgi:hypothetical protein
MLKKPALIYLSLLALALGVGLVIVAWSSKGIIDDAFISYRHSQNLALGHGLVFNPGGTVEGTSATLFAIIMAVPILLGMDPGIFAVVTGFVLAALAITEAARHAARESGSWRCGASAAVVASGVVAYWRTSVHGMEGGLYALLVAETVGYSLAGRPRLTALFGVLANLTRSEAIVLLPACLFALWWRGRRSDPVSGPRPLIEATALWGAGILGIAGCRLAVYGHLKPTCVTTKTPRLDEWETLEYSVPLGFDYVGDFLAGNPIVVLGLILAVIGAWRTQQRFAIPLLCVGAGTVTLASGGDWMPNFRLLVSYLPALAIGAAAGVAVLASSDTVLRLLPRAVWNVVAALACVTLLGWGGARVNWLDAPSATISREQHLYRQIGKRLAPVIGPEHLVSAEAIGIISFEQPQIVFHDFLGLCDEHIAQHGARVLPWGRIDLRYTVDEVRPDVIVLHSGYYWVRQMKAASRDSMSGYSYYAIGSEPDLDGLFQVVAVRDHLRGEVAAALEPLGATAIPAPAPR